MLLARRPLLLAAAALLLLGGCPWLSEAEPCEVTSATEISLVLANADGAVSDVAEDGPLPLISAPQGGFIALVAPRVRVASSACQLQINAALREVSGAGRVIGLEERPITVHRRADGWAAPENPAGLSDLANVAVCPSSVTTAIDGQPFRLEVRVLDQGGGAPLVEASATVRPTCTSAFCRSSCMLQ